MSYLSYAALAGTAIVVIFVVKTFEKVNARTGLSDRLRAYLGEPWSGWAMRLLFVGLAALVAAGVQRIGWILPPELERFVPSEISSLIVAIVAASGYRTGNLGAKRQMAETHIPVESDP